MLESTSPAATHSPQSVRLSGADPVVEIPEFPDAMVADLPPRPTTRPPRPSAFQQTRGSALLGGPLLLGSLLLFGLVRVLTNRHRTADRRKAQHFAQTSGKTLGLGALLSAALLTRFGPEFYQSARRPAGLARGKSWIGRWWGRRPRRLGLNH